MTQGQVIKITYPCAVKEDPVDGAGFVINLESIYIINRRYQTIADFCGFIYFFTGKKTNE